MSNTGERERPPALLVPSFDWDTLVVSGPDRVGWLQGLVTCQLEKLERGAGTWGLALNRQGKIQSVLWVVPTEDELWLAAAPGTGDAVFKELVRMLIMEDAELELPSEPQRWFALHGPAASTRAAELAAGAGGRSAALDWLGIGGAALVGGLGAHPGCVGHAARRA
jgi:folate-binding Fe-S cluster repair protein YgfZ